MKIMKLPMFVLLCAVIACGGCTSQKCTHATPAPSAYQPQKLPAFTPVQPSGPAEMSPAPVAQAATNVTANTAPAPTPVASSDVLELKIEHMSVQKATVPNGTVTLRKTVTTQTVTQPVDIAHDEYAIEHVPSNAAPSTPFEIKSLSVPLSREDVQAVVTPTVKELIRLKKTTVIQKTNITAVVRDENVEMSRESK